MKQEQEIGRVVKSLGGAFTVSFPSGRTVSCRAKGSLRRNDGKLLVGDRVTLSRSDDARLGLAVNEILPRDNALIRPPLANVTHMVLALCGAYPAPSLSTVDKLLAICEHERIAPILAITKDDLASKENQELKEIYEKAGYPVFLLSSLTGEGVSALYDHLEEVMGEGDIAAFAGASGVGKSTLLTALFPTLALQTGTLSEKTERGRHTTRHVELFPFARGYVADTPGFSLLDFEHFDFFGLEDLLSAFPEIAAHAQGCRYDDCSHTKEEGCSVLQGVAQGRIAKSRHETYLSLYAILKEKKNTYPRRSAKQQK